MTEHRRKRPKGDREEIQDIERLARAMHSRLQELEGGGRPIAVTAAMEEVLANDPSYAPRATLVCVNDDPSIADVENAARVLHTTLFALLNDGPHPAVYSGPPSEAEEDRRRIHREASGDATPFTAICLSTGSRVLALIAELPSAQAWGNTEEEALQELSEALDVILIGAYETTAAQFQTAGRPFVPVPFRFQPPGEGRVRSERRWK